MISRAYPQTGEVRKTLSELKAELPPIEAFFGKSIDLQINGATAEGGYSPLFTNPTLRKLTNWFISRANCYSEQDLIRLRGYVGRIDDSQALTFMHRDRHLLRLTLTIADAENHCNPSTLTCADPLREDLDLLFNNAATTSIHPQELPIDAFTPQAEEGSIVVISRGQYHSEAPLNPGTAKLFLSADPID